jgi:alkylation response protein AidB-like acyl-CoA dehydrogenase
LATTHSIRLAVDVVDSVYNASGVTAIFEGNPIQRYFQDIHVISQHTQGRLAHYELIGKYAMGVKVDQTRF